MRNFVFAAVFAASVTIYSAPASAGYDDCMASGSCTTTVTADSGVSGKRCTANGNTCLCSELAGCYLWYVASGCQIGHTNMGTTATGKKCCIRDDQECPFIGDRDGAEVEESIKRNTNKENLDDVFAIGPQLTEVHYGYAGTSLRSPTAGRATSIKARLDVCIGATDVDSAVANGVSWCMNTGCGASQNEHCEATGTNDGQSGVFAAVCKDRCQCMINGVTDPSCDQL